MSSNRPPEPSELIYLPQPSFAPVLVAFGLALLAIGAFGGWVWAAFGLFALLLGVRHWYSTSDDEVSRMRRKQELGTAVIPALPARPK